MIEPLGWAHLLLFGILIPLFAIRAGKVIRERPLGDRRRYFRAMLMQVGLFALFSIYVAHRNWIVIFSRRAPSPPSIATGGALLAIAIAFGWTQWRKAIARRDKVAALFMPVDNRERLIWIAASAVAGFGEEITWRGVQTTLLARLTGNLLVAIAITIAMFSVAHAIQGWKSVGIIAVFSACFHALVWFSGSLYVAMAVHFLYDLVAGFSYAYLGKKMGYFTPVDAGGAAFNRVIPSVSEESGRGIS